MNIFSLLKKYISQFKNKRNIEFANDLSDYLTHEEKTKLFNITIAFLRRFVHCDLNTRCLYNKVMYDAVFKHTFYYVTTIEEMLSKLLEELYYTDENINIHLLYRNYMKKYTNGITSYDILRDFLKTYYNITPKKLADKSIFHNRYHKLSVYKEAMKVGKVYLFPNSMYNVLTNRTDNPGEITIFWKRYYYSHLKLTNL